MPAAKKRRKLAAPATQLLPADLVNASVTFLDLHSVRQVKLACKCLNETTCWRVWALAYRSAPHTSRVPETTTADGHIRSLLYMSHKLRDIELHKFLLTRFALPSCHVYAEYVQYAAIAGVTLWEPLVQHVAAKSYFPFAYLYMASKQHMKNVLSDYVRSSLIPWPTLRTLMCTALSEGDLEMCDWLYAKIVEDGVEPFATNELRTPLYDHALMSTRGTRKSLKWLRKRRVQVYCLRMLGVPFRALRSFRTVFQREIRRCPACNQTAVVFDTIALVMCPCS